MNYLKSHDVSSEIDRTRLSLEIIRRWVEGNKYIIRIG